jgi:drug/metabolite transporter (DMT)-like permease
MTDVSQAHSHRSNLRVGISYILFGMLFLSLLSLISRYTSKNVPLSTILMFQGFIGLIFILPWLYAHGFESLKTKRFGLIFLRSFIGGIGGFVLIFLAVQRTTLVNTLLLSSSSPLYVPLVFWIWKKAPINHLLWPGVIGGFLGVALILQPTQAIVNAGALFALAAGVLGSVNIVANRLLSYTERNHTVLFYYFGITGIVCLPASLYQWVSPTLWDWGGILAIGILTAGMIWCNFRAFHFAKATVLGPFFYSSVIYSVILDWALYVEVPNLLAWIGIAFVCLGGIWTILFGRPEASPPNLVK